MKEEIKIREEWLPTAWQLVTYYRDHISPSWPLPVSTTAPLSVFQLRAPVRVLEEKSTLSVKGPISLWKPFQHYKMVMENPMIEATEGTTWYNIDTNNRANGYVAKQPTVLYGYYLGSGSIGVYDPRVGRPDWANSSAAEPGFVPAPPGLVNFEQAALKAIMPRIKAEFSVINAVYELKDFRHLALLAKSAIARIARLGLYDFASRTFKKGISLVKRPTLSGLSQLAASTYLEWKFAVAPLISDIAATWRAVSNTEKQLRKLLDNAEKVRIGHYSVAFEEYPSSVTDYKAPYMVYRNQTPGNFICAGWSRDTRTQPSKFHVEIEYSYALLGLQASHSKLLAYLDAFGINLNPAIIWNAIPFTFLLDWVVGVSRFLSGLGAGFMDPVVFIRQYLWSIARARRHIGTISYYPIGVASTYGQVYALPLVDETSYRREVKMPALSSLLTTSGLSSTELRLGAALLVSRRSRRRNRS